MTKLERLFNEYLTAINEEGHGVRKVTEDELDAWVGNNGYADVRRKWLERCLTDLADGNDEAEEIRQEIIDYNK